MDAEVRGRLDWDISYEGEIGGGVVGYTGLCGGEESEDEEKDIAKQTGRC